MYLAVLLPSIFALYALYKKKLTNLAVLCAWVMGVVIAYCGGLFPFFALALTFVLTLLSDKLKKGEKDEKRNAYQMISNILTSFVAIVLFYVTKQDVFYVTYYVVIGTSLADTLASSLGSLSILFNTKIIGVFISLNRSMINKSPLPRSSFTSTIKRMTSTSFIEKYASSFKNLPNFDLGLWIPGVSTNII